MHLDLIKLNCENLGWNKMSDLVKIKNVPFGVYSLTSPLTHKPNDNLFPHEYENTLYFGMAGKSYNTSEFYHDKKRSDGKQFWMCSKLYKRINEHRKNLIRTNISKTYDTSYNIFYENYGSGHDLMENVYFNVLIPKVKISDNLVRSWLLMIESTAIYEYSCMFNRQPIMQLAHMTDIGKNNIDQSSYCQKRQKSIENNDLTRFMNG